MCLLAQAREHSDLSFKPQKMGPDDGRQLVPEEPGGVHAQEAGGWH